MFRSVAMMVPDRQVCKLVTTTDTFILILLFADTRMQTYGPYTKVGMHYNFSGTEAGDIIFKDSVIQNFISLV